MKVQQNHVSGLKLDLKETKAELGRKDKELGCLKEQLELQQKTQEQLFRELDCSMVAAGQHLRQS